MRGRFARLGLDRHIPLVIGIMKRDGVGGDRRRRGDFMILAGNEPGRVIQWKGRGEQAARTGPVIEGAAAENLPARGNADLDRRMSRDAARRGERLYLQSHASLLLVNTEIHPAWRDMTPMISSYGCV